MIYPQEVIEEVRASNDIIEVVSRYVALTNRGGNHFGLCPFHNEKTPSFSVNATKQMYHCFGCGAGGNVISFVMQIENYNFLDALKFLADRINYTLPVANASDNAKSKENLRLRKVLQEIHVAAARFYHANLQNADLAESAAVRQYLAERGISAKIVKKFGLGFSLEDWDKLYKHLQEQKFNVEDMLKSGLVAVNKNGGYYDRFRNRLMFPIIDVDNNVLGFGGRIIEPKESQTEQIKPTETHTAKYINSSESPIFSKGRLLYGINAARKAQLQNGVQKDIIIVEGYMDVIALHQAGFPQTVGVLGTALTSQHCRLLKRINCNAVILLFDRDTAGLKAMYKAIPILLNEGIKVRCLQVTEDVKDPDEYIKKYGASGFVRLLQQAKNHASFRIDLLAKSFDINDSEQRVTFTQQAARVLADINSPIETNVYVQETAEFTGLSENAILTEVVSQRKQNFSTDKPPKERQNMRQNSRNSAVNNAANNSKKNNAAFIKARKGLLNLLVLYPQLAAKIKETLPLEDLGDIVAIKILQLTYQNSEQNITAAPASIISQFETLEEQQQAADLLKNINDFESLYPQPQIAEKALHHMSGTIKKVITQTQAFAMQEDSGDFSALGRILVGRS
ncbi:MAG: DNA primase [Defluviitaleaceae bacterium]|nr:DNA primase [Defluviitaleaceae bacterium]